MNCIKCGTETEEGLEICQSCSEQNSSSAGFDETVKDVQSDIEKPIDDSSLEQADTKEQDSDVPEESKVTPEGRFGSITGVEAVSTGNQRLFWLFFSLIALFIIGFFVVSNWKERFQEYENAQVINEAQVVNEVGEEQSNQEESLWFFRFISFVVSNWIKNLKEDKDLQKINEIGQEQSNQENPSSLVTTEPEPVATPVFLPSAFGSLQSADTNQPVRAALAVYNRINSRLELAVFTTGVEEKTQQEALSVSSLKYLSAQRPDAVFSMFLRPGTELCEEDSLFSYQASLFANPNVLPFDFEADFPDGKTGVSEMNCELGDPGVLRLNLRWNGSRQDGASAIPVGWDVQVVSKVYLLQQEGKLSFSSKNSAAALAILSTSKEILEVGFYAGKITPEDVRRIRSEQTLLALIENQPVVTVVFQLRKDSSELRTENILNYGLNFKRNRKAEINFPGTSDNVSFYYVPSTEPGEQLTGLSGPLLDMGRVRGKLKYAASKSLEEIACHFEWDIDFDLLLIDAAVQGKSLADETKILEDQSDDAENSAEPYARAFVESEAVQFKSAIGFYYPEEKNVFVGFFVDALSDQEKIELVKRRSLWNPINGKQANLVLIFDFKPATAEASIFDLASYEAVFVRDKIGTFYFPGSYDRVNMVRKVDDLEKGELQKLVGQLEANGKLDFRMRNRKFRLGDMNLGVELNASVSLVEIK